MIVVTTIITTFSNIFLVGWFQVHVNEIIFQDNFELVSHEWLVLLNFLFVDVEIKVNCLYFLDSQYRNCQQWLVAASNCVASTLIVSESIFCDLDPSVDECWVITSFILHKFTLKEYIIILVHQVDIFILRWHFFLLSESWSAICTHISIQIDINILYNILCLAIAL